MIVEEPSSCIIELSADNEKKQLADYFNFDIDEFINLLKKYKNIERIKTNLGNEEVIVSELYANNYLIVGKKKVINDLLNLFKN